MESSAATDRRTTCGSSSKPYNYVQKGPAPTAQSSGVGPPASHSSGLHIGVELNLMRCNAASAAAAGTPSGSDRWRPSVDMSTEVWSQPARNYSVMLPKRRGVYGESSMAILGGCHCGALRYGIDVDALDDVANCHCTICRRTTGAAFTTWASVPRDAFRWESGTPRVYRSGSDCERYFCPSCGAQLALHTTLAPHVIDVTVGTLNAADLSPPTRNVWVKNRLAWVALGDALLNKDEETL